MSEAFADLETPLSLYMKTGRRRRRAGGGRYSFLLESVIGGERFRRPASSAAGAHFLRASGFRLAARTEVVTDGGGRNGAGQPSWTSSMPPAALQVALRPGLPCFCGGLRATGYDVVRHVSRRSCQPVAPPDTLGTPDILLMHCEELAVIDNLSGKLYLIVYADPAQPGVVQQRQEAFEECCASNLRYSVAAPQVKPIHQLSPSTSFAKADYLAAVGLPKN